ncbi:asparagine-tRNA ligase [Venturia nashicola]|nr:asparagine-tRNA ligase [Venturia nashicola]
MGNNDSAVRYSHAIEQVESSRVKQTYPIQKKYHTPEFLRTLPHLRSRLPFNSLVLRLRSHLIRNSTTFFDDRQFVQTHPPIITSSDCEGAGEVFTVTVAPERTKKVDPTSDQFFRSTKYLTVSSQLHLEALAQSVGKVWTLSPTFRAEKSDTPRHLSEFYMLEAELCFIEHVSDVMDVVESLLRNITSQLQKSTLSEELMSAWSSRPQDQDSGMTQQNLATRWQRLTGDRWPRLAYKEAITILQEAVSRKEVRFDFPPELGSSLQVEHEKYLAEAVGKGSPVFVTDYPRDIKAFYMAPSSPSDGSLPTVACFDLLVPDLCEIAGGSMREYRLDPLLNAMDAHGLLKQADLTPDLNAAPADSQLVLRDLVQRVPPDLEWYVDLRRYGSVPHGGFGLGFDRLLSYLSGVPNIRDVVGFPRWYGRCDC